MLFYILVKKMTKKGKDKARTSIYQLQSSMHISTVVHGILQLMDYLEIIPFPQKLV